MTTQSPPLFNQTGSYPAVQLRQLIAALSPPGILKSGDLLVSALGTPNMSVNVAGGSAVIAGTEATTQGSYLFFNDAVVNVPIAASDPTNPRNDLIVAVIRDAADYSGANNDARLIAVTGTPAGSPADPATPNNAIVLARVRVDATVTTIVAGKVTDLRALRNAILPVTGFDAAIAGAPVIGASPFVVQAGAHAGVTDATGNMTLTFAPAFPNGLLSLVVSAGTSVGNETVQVVNASCTRSLAVVKFYNANSNTVVNTQARTFNWIAIGF